MDQLQRDDRVALREERRVALEQLRAVQEDLHHLDEQSHDLDRRLHNLQGTLESAEGMAMLVEQQQIARRIGDLLLVQQDLVTRYRDLHERSLALLRSRRP